MLSSLEGLDLSGNAFTPGPVPAVLADLPGLHWLTLADAGLTM